jgi:3-deoxy-D-manno-octulosonate 8-phosphate phosphatase KdsC-like HAD superfamily phosphatase
MRTEESLTGEDWVEIEGLESYKKFDLMEEFAEQQETEVANALLQALGGKGSFRRFKDVLINYPAVQKEWYEFEHKWLEAKANEFLDEIYENDGGEGE